MRALPVVALAFLAACATPLERRFPALTDFPQAPASPPLRPDATLTRIILTSCSNEERASPAFDTVRAARPDLLLMLGDNVYGSSTPEDSQLSDLRSSYVRQLQRASFTDLVSSVPTLAVWDDHDFGRNDAGGDFAHKRLAEAMFERFWRAPADDPRRSREGVYASTIVGPPGRRVQVILLDTRFFRSPLKTLPQTGEERPFGRYDINEDPGATVLGEAQWRWLEAELRKPADLRLLATSYQLVVDGHNYERWGNFPAERRRLYALIRDTGARGVVVLSGDRHMGAIYREDRVVGYPLYELTGSAINMPSTPRDPEEPGPQRLGAPVRAENFGQVDIDWTARRLVLRIVDAKGVAAREAVVPFEAIGAAAQPS